MKKILMVIALTFICIASFGQFTYKVVDNDFDAPFKKAWCFSLSSSPDEGILEFESGFTHPRIYISGTYFCDDSPSINASFNNGHKYLLGAEKGKNSKYVHIVPYCLNYDLNSELCHEEWNNFWQDMKTCSTVKFRINESHCKTNIYYFSLKNSTAAINFVTDNETK